MEPFLIHILGCGSALPTLKHYASSQIVEVRGKMFMIDCGEGTQLQLRRYHIGFNRIQGVFISHLHGDHCFGLIGMISTFGMLGRTAPLTIYAPADLGSLLKMQLSMFCDKLEYEVKFVAIQDTTQQRIIYEDKSITVETVPLQHRIPCCGFIFREKKGLRHIRRDMIDCYEIPISQLNLIRQGADYTTPEGEVIRNEQLTYPADEPRSYAYCSDTRFIPTLWQNVEHVTALYHDSTYNSQLQSRASLYYHSTSAQAAQVALKAGAKQLILGHFSARFDDETVLLKEAKEIFTNTVLANEGEIIRIE